MAGRRFVQGSTIQRRMAAKAAKDARETAARLTHHAPNAQWVDGFKYLTYCLRQIDATEHREHPTCPICALHVVEDRRS